MNYFLILIILGLGWGGFYEYNQMVQQNARDKQEFQDTINSKMAHLQDENTKLQVENAELKKDLADAKAKMGPATNGATPSNPTNGLSAVMAAPAPPKVPLPSNNLGIFAATDQRRYENCHLLKVRSDGIVISCTQGVIELKWKLLPPQLQQRFGYDYHVGYLPDDQVETMEQQRIQSEQQDATAGQ